MNTHGINFAPESWGVIDRPPWHSVAATGVVALLLVMLGLVGGSPPPVADAAAPTSASGPGPERIGASENEAAYWPLWRAAWHLPWDQLCVDLTAGLPPGARLTEIRYDGDQRRLEVSGEISEVAHLPGLMVRLGDYPWLSHPDPFRVELDPATGRTQFTLRLNVLPFLELLETPQP